MERQQSDEGGDKRDSAMKSQTDSPPPALELRFNPVFEREREQNNRVLKGGLSALGSILVLLVAWIGIRQWRASDRGPQPPAVPVVDTDVAPMPPIATVLADVQESESPPEEEQYVKDVDGETYRVTGMGKDGALLATSTGAGFHLKPDCSVVSSDGHAGKWVSYEAGFGILITAEGLGQKSYAFPGQALSLGKAVTCQLVLDDARLSVGGLGPIRIGMTVEQLAQAGYGIAKPEYGDIGECAQVKLRDRSDIGLMFQEGKISRVEITKNGIASGRGIRVGDPEAKVRQLYGAELETNPSVYDENGHSLSIKAKDGDSRMVFETDGRVVTEMRAGLSAGYVEGCL